jgi:uncharacterized membrane protein
VVNVVADAPAWGLTVTYWLHMLATVAWIGGLAALALLVLPAARSSLDPGGQAALLARIQRRLDPLAWFSLLVLLGTGLFQMSASPNYQGFLAVENTWAAAILVKHLVFGGMVAVSAWNTWGLLPALRRAALRQAALKKTPPGAAGGADSPEMERLQRQSQRLLNVNLVLSVMVLLLTALARVS